MTFAPIFSPKVCITSLPSLRRNKPLSTKTDVENATQTMGEGDNGSISTSIKAVKGLQLYTKKGISVFGFETAIRQKVGRLLAQFAPGALNTAVSINRSRYSLLDFYLLKMISLNSRRASMTGARTVEAMTSIANYEKKILKFMEDLKNRKDYSGERRKNRK